MWEVEQKLGYGTYSEIYSANHVHNRTRCALKIDKPSPKDALSWEANILFKLQKYPLVARHYGLMCVESPPHKSSACDEIIRPKSSIAQLI